MASVRAVMIVILEFVCVECRADRLAEGLEADVSRLRTMPYDSRQQMENEGRVINLRTGCRQLL